MPNIEKIIKLAVDEAARAWNKNEELRKLFGKAKKNTTYPIIAEDAGKFLQLIHSKRQILHIKVPPNDGMLAHAVIGLNDYYATTKTNFAVRETILLSDKFFSDNVRNMVSFDKATAKEKSAASDIQMRAVILLHETRHLYSITGHGVDPASYDPTWNDYILWTGFLGQKVAW